MFGREWRIGSIGGVDIRVDSSWTLIAILVVYSEWIRFTDPGTNLSESSAWAVAILASFLLFSSVLIHELAHAGMARAQNIPVSGITLFLFGGATSARVEDKGPGAEFLVTAVGPGSSFALAAIFWALSHALGRPLDVAFADLSRINFLLAVFNLIPGFPLDGGRILRSAIWRGTGSLERATRVAAVSGVIVGAAFIVWGVSQAIITQYPGALWLAMIGWFLFRAARGSVQHQGVRRALAGGVVREAMRPPPASIQASISLSEALDRYLRGHEDEIFPVVDGDRVVGLLTFESARRIGREDPLRPVRDAALPLDGGVAAVGVGDRLDTVLDQVGDREAMVLDEGRLVGTIGAGDIDRWLRDPRHR
ncbi:MAG: site-2 protease family protein [Actinomycetota bacterium]